MRQKRGRALRVVWEPVADSDYREKLRQALEIILGDDLHPTADDGFDENPLLAQYEAGAGKQPSPNKGRVSNAN
jgi:hypothetical protein